MIDDPTRPLRIDPDGIYSDATLILSLGVTAKTLARERRAGCLRHMKRGRLILYRGAWILEWLDSEPKGVA